MEQSIATALAIVAIVIGSLFLKAGVISWNLWFMHARPALGDRIYAAYTNRPVRATILGVLNSAALLFAAIILLQNKPLALLGILLLAGLCAAHLCGRTAAYRLMAERLGSEPGILPDFHGLLRAALLTELAFLLPVLGQLLFLAVTLRSAGAFSMAVLSGKTTQSPGAEE